MYRIKQKRVGLFTLRHMQVWSKRIHSIDFYFTRTVYIILRSPNFYRSVLNTDIRMCVVIN